MMKKLPIGIEYFKDFKRDNFYYIDKTGFVCDLVNTRGSVNLFTRPRRFGKSLNMDMLSYYGIEKSFDEIKEWYDGYHFGEADMYCPWDVINQCDKLRVWSDAPMEAHWANSSSNAIVQDILADATETTKRQMEDFNQLRGDQ